jgi:hypothetical protein
MRGQMPPSLLEMTLQSGASTQDQEQLHSHPGWTSIQLWTLPVSQEGLDHLCNCCEIESDAMHGHHTPSSA